MQRLQIFSCRDSGRAPVRLLPTVVAYANTKAPPAPSAQSDSGDDRLRPDRRERMKAFARRFLICDRTHEATAQNRGLPTRRRGDRQRDPEYRASAAELKHRRAIHNAQLDQRTWRERGVYVARKTLSTDHAEPDQALLDLCGPAYEKLRVLFLEASDHNRRHQARPLRRSSAHQAAK